jgi:hypothetical protein
MTLVFVIHVMFNLCYVLFKQEKCLILVHCWILCLSSCSIFSKLYHCLALDNLVRFAYCFVMHLDESQWKIPLQQLLQHCIIFNNKFKIFIKQTSNSKKIDLKFSLYLYKTYNIKSKNFTKPMGVIKLLVPFCFHNNI